jgi:phosphonate transport system substrate-binding protein
MLKKLYHHPQRRGLGPLMRLYGEKLMRYGGLLLSFCLLAACQQQDSGGDEPRFSEAAPVLGQEYVFAVHPLHNPVRLFEVYGPVVDYLGRHIAGSRFRLEASRNYGEFEKKLYGRLVAFALPNPYQTLEALRHGYHVIAKMADDHKFTGIILVRRDSGIRQVADLKGKKVAYPAPTALAATMMPQYYLQTHGLDVNRDIENLYVGSQESSIMNVYLGNVAAAATWPLPWESFQREQPGKARELAVQWQTEPLINNSVVARDDVPDELAQEVARLLDTLHSSEEGRAILARMPLSRFEPADDARYQVVADFLQRFSQAVRPLAE